MSKLKVQWPDGAYSTEGDDLSEPIQALLRDMHLLEQPAGDQAKVPWGLRNTTPFAMQVITAGSTALSKITTTVVAAFGGAAALGAAVLAFLQDDRNSAPLMLVLVGSVAVVLSATVLAIALIVRADLSARSAATSAEYRARAETAAALLQGFGRSRPSPAPEPRYWTKTRNGTVYPVKGLVLKGGEIRLQAGGQELSPQDLDCLTAYADWQPNVAAAAART